MYATYGKYACSNPAASVNFRLCFPDAAVSSVTRTVSRTDGKPYRLPTEADWEYACRASTRTRYSFGNNPSQLGEYAWYCENSGEATHPVGQKRANAWGLHDMLGNVWEWCSDWYVENYYEISAVDDPHGPTDGLYRVIRGGGWFNDPRSCRSAERSWGGAEGGISDFGFRVALISV